MAHVAVRKMIASYRVLGTALVPWLRCATLTGIIITALSRTALAYRPFDGTDAAVAKPGELEGELAPADLLREHSQSTVISGFAILNFGIAPDWEAVFSGQGQIPQFAGDDPFSIANVSAFLKAVVRPGVLQDKSGPSVAVDWGTFAGGIVSQRWDWGTINLNLQGECTRDHHADAASAIIEGPYKWKVRPVSEFFMRRK
jgi:hypothetical protein